MPYQYRIDTERSILRIDISDPTSYEEIVEGVQQLIADPALYEGLQVLNDQRNLDFLASPDLIKSLPPLFTELGSRIGPHRTAIVVSSKASFGMTRMAELISNDGPAEIRPFWSLEEAEAWLTS